MINFAINKNAVDKLPVMDQEESAFSFVPFHNLALENQEDGATSSLEKKVIKNTLFNRFIIRYIVIDASRLLGHVCYFAPNFEIFACLKLFRTVPSTMEE